MKVKQKSIFWGIILILAAALLLLDGSGIMPISAWGMSPFRIFLAVLCLGWLVRELLRGRIFDIFFPAAFLFILTEDLIATLVGRPGEDLISGWILILAAAMLTAGFHGIFREKKKKGPHHLGNCDQYFDGSDLSHAEVTDMVGQVKVYIANAELYTGGGCIWIHDVVGDVIVHIPGNWLVTSDVSDKVGSVVIPPRDREVYDKTIILRANDFVGKIEVIFQ